MANLSNVFAAGFDANTVAPSTGYELLPRGKYPMIITDSEIKQTKAGDGQYLQLVQEVIDGHYKGRKLFSRLNVVNKNKTAEDIAHRTLSSLCRATGVMQLQDSGQLHNIPFMADVGVSKEGDQNDIKAYASMGNAAATPATFTNRPAAAPAAARPAAAGATPPWKR